MSFAAVPQPAGPRLLSRRRLRVIASRKAGPSVKRNYAKRVLRELFRRHPEALPASCDARYSRSFKASRRRVH